MKKMFAALCALLLLPTMALCDEIESIRNAVQSGLYDTEKINYALIYIPDVSKINVIRAEKYEANPEIVQKYENAGMIAIEKMKMATLLYMGDEYDKKYGVDKRTQFLEYHIDSAWKLDDEELDNIYAQKQPCIFFPVSGLMKIIVFRCSSAYRTHCIVPDRRFRSLS